PPTPPRSAAAGEAPGRRVSRAGKDNASCPFPCLASVPLLLARRRSFRAARPSPEELPQPEGRSHRPEKESSVIGFEEDKSYCLFGLGFD
ncbi:unnamed protein product, partial [Urochloa humidicola]